jgi:hypothetical protein
MRLPYTTVSQVLHPLSPAASFRYRTPILAWGTFDWMNFPVDLALADVVRVVADRPRVLLVLVAPVPWPLETASPGIQPAWRRSG